MTRFHNSLDQPIGFPVRGWEKRPPPPPTAMEGRTCRVEPIDPDRHAAELHKANLEDAENRIWTYLAYGPQTLRDDQREDLVSMALAAVYSAHRTSASPHFEICPSMSISPDWKRLGVRPKWAATVRDCLKRDGSSTPALKVNAVT